MPFPSCLLEAHTLLDLLSKSVSIRYFFCHPHLGQINFYFSKSIALSSLVCKIRKSFLSACSCLSTVSAYRIAPHLFNHFTTFWYNSLLGLSLIFIYFIFEPRIFHSIFPFFVTDVFQSTFSQSFAIFLLNTISRA